MGIVNYIIESSFLGPLFKHKSMETWRVTTEDERHVKVRSKHAWRVWDYTALCAVGLKLYYTDCLRWLVYSYAGSLLNWLYKWGRARSAR